MKKFILIFLFFICQLISAQFIKGNITTEENLPLKNVSVYIDGSTINTVTDDKGNFYLPTSFKSGNLIFSKNDYSKIIFQVKDAIGKNLKVILQKEKLIEEISLIPYTDKDFDRNFSIFQYAFLGEINNTKILNKKDLLFAVDRKNDIFLTKAKKPLIIENKFLGYKITFDLINFEKNTTMVTYNGTTFFEELNSSKSLTGKYRTRREEAFLGSAAHFFQSLFIGKTRENGFNINAAKIIPNPNYPTEAEIEKYKIAFKKSFELSNGKSAIVLTKEISNIGKRTQNPKTLLIILKTSIPESDYAFRKNNELFLKFNNLLQIVYLSKNGKTIDTLVDSGGLEFQIFPDGYYTDPDQLIFNGTWGEYKVSKMLPTNFYIEN